MNHTENKRDPEHTHMCMDGCGRKVVSYYPRRWYLRCPHCAAGRFDAIRNFRVYAVERLR